jgi:parallel beta-helix repeat protein
MSIGTRLLAVALLALAVGGGHAFAQGHAAQPSCGDVITTDTTLAGDLTNCPGDGLVIGADSVTLDLNGHTVDGDGTPGAAGPNVGILNEGYDGVTIENGTVREFDFGLLLRAGSAGEIRGVATTHNSRAGMRLEGLGGNRFTGNTSAENGTFGVNFFGGNHDNLFESNTVADNGDGGIGDFVSDHDRFAYNTVTGNAEDGISVGGSTDTVVEHNSVSDNFAGIAVFGSDRNQVKSNRVAGNHFGIIVDGDDNSVVENDVSDSVGCDDDEGCGLGISVEGGAENLVAKNHVSDTASNGIALNAFGAPVSGNVFRENHIRDAGADGIAIGPVPAGPVLDTLLEGNHVSGASDDGIDVDSSTTTLTRNHATRNGDLGIEAVPGVVDGGGNHAAGNGNPAQCTNVAC